MTLHGFQQALSELVLSSDLRTRVADQGASALEAYDLDPREERRLVAIAGQPGLNTGVLIHRSFRLSMLIRSLPRTCRLLGDRLSDLVHDYWNEHLPLHYNFVWESCRFSTFLRDRVRAGSLVEPLLGDMLRIDLASMALQRSLEPEQVGLDPLPGGADLISEPTHNRYVVVCEHDPRALLTRADEDETSTVPTGDYWLALERLPNGGIEFELA